MRNLRFPEARHPGPDGSTTDSQRFPRGRPLQPKFLPEKSGTPVTSTTANLHTDQADSTHVVATVWPNLVPDEIAALLSHYPGLDGPYRLGSPSTRPLSAAAVVRTSGAQVFVKRHHRSVRDGADLGREHALIAHLAEAGYPTPVPLRDRDGATALELTWDEREWSYEVFPLALGEDRYRGRNTWTPFESQADAHASGVALARFHQASQGFSAAARPAGVLRSRPRVFGIAADPFAELARLAGELPGLNAFLADRDWHHDLQPHLRFHERLHPLLTRLEPLWTHNDWHASNQFFTGHEVTSVIDFGLADLTTRVYDLAIALERNTLQWPDLLSGDDTAFRLDQAAGILSGYASIAVLSELEKPALLALLPLTQADAALSALEYYHRILAEPAMARWGYEGFLIDHTNWFTTPAGRRYLAGLEALLG